MLRMIPGPNVLLTALTTVLFLGLPDSLAGQDSPPVVPSLYRQLAEAADGYRTGKETFFIAMPTPPHDVRGPFASRDEAHRAAATAGRRFAVYGPFIASRDSIPRRGSELVSVSLRFRTNRGDSVVQINPREVDALFFSLSSVDKFMIPYYVQVRGLDYASRLRNQIIAFGSGPTCHWARTLPCRIDMTGVQPLPADSMKGGDRNQRN
ncbi:MAG: hypothetical protein ABI679_04310 [Gemmatimonadota bacterium]